MAEYKEKMSQQHFEEMQAKLAYLKGTRRDEIAAALAEARSHGDLSENAEYDEARNEQARLEAEIVQLAHTLENAEIIKVDTNEGADVIETGSYVKLRRDAFNGQPEKIESFQIVGRSEADYSKHKISDDSPIGAAAIGKRLNERFEVEAPIGFMNFTVLEISLSAPAAEE